MVEPQSDTGENDAPIRPVSMQDGQRMIPVTVFSSHEDIKCRCFAFWPGLEREEFKTVLAGEKIEVHLLNCYLNKQ